jgi:hypothetical protein
MFNTDFRLYVVEKIIICRRYLYAAKHAPDKYRDNVKKLAVDCIKHREDIQQGHSSLEIFDPGLYLTNPKYARIINKYSDYYSRKLHSIKETTIPFILNDIQLKMKKGDVPPNGATANGVDEKERDPDTHIRFESDELELD